MGGRWMFFFVRPVLLVVKKGWENDKATLAMWTMCVYIDELT